MKKAKALPFVFYRILLHLIEVCNSLFALAHLKRLRMLFLHFVHPSSAPTQLLFGALLVFMLASLILSQKLILCAFFWSVRTHVVRIHLCPSGWISANCDMKFLFISNDNHGFMSCLYFVSHIIIVIYVRIYTLYVDTFAMVFIHFIKFLTCFHTKIKQTVIRLRWE